VWDEFAGNRELLRSVANGIRAARALPEVALPAVADEDEEGFAEGRVLYRLHRSRERNKTLVEEAKKAAMKQHGHLKCTVCNFDFVARYGDLGLGYIEAHHTVALSELGAEAKTKVSDLALVCSNCHRMLHRRRPWLTVVDLKSLVRTS
jgi:5-methylcytosine-specific restriction protein A